MTQAKISDFLYLMCMNLSKANNHSFDRRIHHECEDVIENSPRGSPFSITRLANNIETDGTCNIEVKSMLQEHFDFNFNFLSHLQTSAAALCSQ